MAQIPTTRGNPQASEIAVQDALTILGSLSREDLQTTLGLINADTGMFLEDRNILLTQGGNITFTGTQVQFTEALKLEINSQTGGGAPTVIDLGSSNRSVSADGRMIYAVIDRSAGTATVTADAATLPTVTSANKEVFLIAKRVDDGAGIKKLYFRNGFTLEENQSAYMTKSGHLLEGIASTTTSGGTLTLTKTSKVYQRLTGTNSHTVVLPDATTMQDSDKFIISNRSTTSIDIEDDGNNALKTLDPDSQARFVLADNGTSDGTWDIENVAAGEGGFGGINYIENWNAEDNNTTGWGEFDEGIIVPAADINFGDDEIEKTSHGFVDGLAVRYRSTGTVIGGLTNDEIYYVVNAASDDFQLSDTKGGSEIDLTSQGTGNHHFGPAEPRDGTGGSAANFALSTQAFVVLRDSYSFYLSKSGSVPAQGQGINYDFTIDEADKGKRLRISFDWRTDSAYDTNDMGVYIYDKDNSNLIRPSYTNLPATEDSTTKIQVYFNATDADDYRLILYAQSQSTSNYKVYFDNVVVGPEDVVQGLPFSEAIEIPDAAVSNIATNVQNQGGYYWRVGNRMIVQAGVEWSGVDSTTTAVNPIIPDGLSVDTTKLKSGWSDPEADRVTVGSWHFWDTGSNESYGCTVVYDIGDDLIYLNISNGNNTVRPASNRPVTIAAGDSIHWQFEVPIAEWAGSSVGLANSRVEYASNNGTWTNNDTTSFQYGPSGQIMGGALPAARYKRVRFLTPIQSTDKLTLEVSEDQDVWLEVTANVSGLTVPTYNYDGTNNQGVMLLSVAGSKTDVDVYFAEKMWKTSDWPSNIYWRVSKSSNPLSVSFIPNNELITSINSNFTMSDYDNIGTIIGTAGSSTFNFVDGDVTVGTDTIDTGGAHGLSNGDTVWLNNNSGTLPTGLTHGKTYFVIGVSGTAFKLSETVGGSAVNITAASGGGTHSLNIGITATLPTAANNINRKVVIKKSDDTGQRVVIVGSIDGDNFKNLYKQGDTITVQCDGSSWFVIESRFKSKGQIRIDTPTGYGSAGSNKIRKWTSGNKVIIGRAIGYTSDSVNGDVFHIHEPGVYAISYSDSRSGATNDFLVGISLNAPTTTNLSSLTAAQRLVEASSTGNSAYKINAKVTVLLDTGDKIRAHSNGNLDTTDARSQFTITQVTSSG